MALQAATRLRLVAAAEAMRSQAVTAAAVVTAVAVVAKAIKPIRGIRSVGSVVAVVRQPCCSSTACLRSLRVVVVEAVVKLVAGGECLRVEPAVMAVRLPVGLVRRVRVVQLVAAGCAAVM
jgi:hypothetical protein